MKTRLAAIAVLAVFVVLTSSAVVTSSDSDALADPYTLTTNPGVALDPYALYYYNQLTNEQKVLYEKMEAVDTNPVLNVDTYEYTVIFNLDEPSLAKAKEDVLAAWGALRLDNAYALVTWTKGNPVPVIYYEYIAPELTSITITMDPMFATAADDRDQIKAKIDAMDVKGNDVPEKVKSINSLLAGSDYKYKDDGATGIHALKGDGPYELNAFGFSAMVKALCFKSGIDMNCMQVYGTLADGSKNTAHAWNVIIVDDGKTYAVDTAVNNRADDGTWLLAGRYTSHDGDSFGKVHLAFAFNTSTELKFDFESELLCNDGYEWPQSTGIMDILEEYAPWILIGAICIVLAIYLFVTARKGGNI